MIVKETKKLEISKDLEKKIEFICRFANVKYKLINGNIISLSNTNIAYVRPHILQIENNDYLLFDDSDDVFINGYKNKIKLKDLEKDRIGNYKLSKKQKVRLETLLENFSKMEKEFDKLSSYMTKLNLHEDKTNYYKDNIRKLSREKDQIIYYKDKYEKENHNLKMSKDFLESYKRVKNIEIIKVISED